MFLHYILLENHLFPDRVDLHDHREMQENEQVVGNDTSEKTTFVVSNSEE